MTASERRQVWVRPLPAELLAGAKSAFATRRVPRPAMVTLLGGAIRPRSGDLVLAKVVRLGQHRKLEAPDGRRANLHVDDHIVVAFGDRYAPDQFEALVPNSLGPTQLVASGGIASSMRSRSRDVSAATDIEPIGLIGDERGCVLNLAKFALPAIAMPLRRYTVAVVGTSMNSGKTTTIQYLAHTLARLGLRPGVTKVTGTGSGGDYWVMLDAGAHRMLDFTDAGFASTYKQPIGALEMGLLTLLAHLGDAGCGVNLVEVADGLFQRETSRLITSSAFIESVDTLLFAAGEAMGAAAGVAHLKQLGLPVVAVSGRLTRSPLAVREAAEATNLPVLGIPELSDPGRVQALLDLAGQGKLDTPHVLEHFDQPSRRDGGHHTNGTNVGSPWARSPIYRQVNPAACSLDEASPQLL